MAYSRLVSEKTFEKIWEFWINKEGERAAEKAIDVCLKSGEDAKKIIEACEAYRLENLGKDPEFTYKLSNFILQDHWKDVSDSISVEALKKLHDDSVTLIKEWNNTCRSHWCKVVDIESKVPVVMKALKDKAFKENWSKALKKASGIFKLFL